MSGSSGRARQCLSGGLRMIVWINSEATERRGAVTERNVDTHGETVQRFRSA